MAEGLGGRTERRDITMSSRKLLSWSSSFLCISCHFWIPVSPSLVLSISYGLDFLVDPFLCNVLRPAYFAFSVLNSGQIIDLFSAQMLSLEEKKAKKRRFVLSCRHSRMEYEWVTCKVFELLYLYCLGRSAWTVLYALYEDSCARGYACKCRPAITFLGDLFVRNAQSWILAVEGRKMRVTWIAWRGEENSGNWDEKVFWTWNESNNVCVLCKELEECEVETCIGRWYLVEHFIGKRPVSGKKNVPFW